MSWRDFLRALKCWATGHSWSYYRYPNNDGWFSAHDRRECLTCGKDEAVIWR